MCVSTCYNSYALSDLGACVPGATCASYSKVADNSSNTCVP
jgi:hypothetical protein